MPRLKNPNHEKLAQTFAKESLQATGKVIKTRVYQKVYKDASYDSARAEGPRLLATPAIQARIQEIIASKNHPEDIAEDLSNLRKATKEHVTPTGQIIEVKDNSTRLGAVQTCLKVMGGFSDQPPQDNRQIIFNLKAEEGFLQALSQTIEKLGVLNEKLGQEPKNA